jgi:PilZ domain
MEAGMDGAILEFPRSPQVPERRTSLRLLCNLPILCRTTAHSQSGGQWVGTVQDISIGGVSVVLSRRFEPGTVLIVELQDGTGESACTQLARVSWVSGRRNGGWLLGCTWSRPLSAEDLQPLVRPSDMAHLTGRRAA